ncbi:cyclic nucleotide-gated cation channel beta-1-like [Juglans regia]|uniref:Cyclic nucleotide-gated cation channel beta-1-like n=1 Tax=Juglans regia TaxID=51240 RepID=A0A6P9EJ05_JUGRE|nr:cyclic nucleotide-gated cation channel beta-1-like [Juglans regia]
MGKEEEETQFGTWMRAWMRAKFKQKEEGRNVRWKQKMITRNVVGVKDEEKNNSVKEKEGSQKQDEIQREEEINVRSEEVMSKNQDFQEDERGNAKMVSTETWKETTTENQEKKSEESREEMSEMGERIDISDCLMKLFKSTTPSDGDIEACLQAVAPCVTEEMNDNLSMPFCRDEVEEAPKHMAPLKSLGPDSFGAYFFQKHWQIVGDEVGKLEDK